VGLYELNLHLNLTDQALPVAYSYCKREERYHCHFAEPSFVHYPLEIEVTGNVAQSALLVTHKNNALPSLVTVVKK
jgi:hypothetical protein